MRTKPKQVLAGLPPWMTALIEYHDPIRSEARTLLEQAKVRLAEIEAKPPADSAAVAVAVLHPFHLTVKALLAAHAMKSFSTLASLELLRLLYGTELPEDLLQLYVGVQRVTIQGAKSIEAAKSFIDHAAQLIAKTS